jgi:hypothetical protein
MTFNVVIKPAKSRLLASLGMTSLEDVGKMLNVYKPGANG